MKILIKLFSIICVSLHILACSKIEQEDTYKLASLFGVIYDNSTGYPVPDCRVELLEDTYLNGTPSTLLYSSVTGSDGSFSIDGIEVKSKQYPRTLYIRLSCEQYNTMQQRIKVAYGQTSEISLNINPK